MVIQTWLITGLVASSLALIVFIVAGAVTETNVIGFIVLVGTMTLITLIRKFARTRVT